MMVRNSFSECGHLTELGHSEEVESWQGHNKMEVSWVSGIETGYFAWWPAVDI